MPKKGYIQTKKHLENLSKARKGGNKGSFKKNHKPYKKFKEEHPMWKTDEEILVHSWIIRKKGKAKNYKCELCSKQAHDWSNKDHKYRKVLEDWQHVCRGCHQKWDYKYNNCKRNDKKSNQSA